MPERETIEREREDAREGKSPSTQAGEFVREEMHHIREGRHGAASAKQAIAIGLSKARRSGVKLGPPRRGKSSVSATRKAEQDYRKGQSRSAGQLLPSDPVPPRTLSRRRAAPPPRMRLSPGRLELPRAIVAQRRGAVPRKRAVPRESRQKQPERLLNTSVTIDVIFSGSLRQDFRPARPWRSGKFQAVADTRVRNHCSVISLGSGRSCDEPPTIKR